MSVARIALSLADAKLDLFFSLLSLPLARG